MATITITHDNATITDTEYFLASDSTTATYQTLEAVVELQLDLQNLVAGDTLRFRAYSKVNGQTARPYIDIVLSGAYTENMVFPARLLGEGWEFSLDRTSATSRIIYWSIRKLTP